MRIATIKTSLKGLAEKNADDPPVNLYLPWSIFEREGSRVK
jgi:hypothetical protein